MMAMSRAKIPAAMMTKTNENPKLAPPSLDHFPFSLKQLHKIKNNTLKELILKMFNKVIKI